MPKLEHGNGDWSAALELALRGAVYALTGVATLALVALFGFAALIAIGGTGGFTSSPPPEHPAWVGLTVTLCLYALLQWGLIRLQGYLLACLDGRFGGSAS
jgi:hypothetical protein